MKIYIEAAKLRGDALDHVLFMDRLDWEKQRWLILLLMKSTQI
jgi:hypothetical protein